MSTGRFAASLPSRFPDEVVLYGSMHVDHANGMAFEFPSPAADFIVGRLEPRFTDWIRTLIKKEKNSGPGFFLRDSRQLVEFRSVL